jgi:Fe-S-cluster containining protein
MVTANRLASADRAFTGAVDDVVRAAARRAGKHVRCRLGCTSCCIGVFDVTALDAARLLQALRRLRRRRTALAAALERRARRQWRLIVHDFPGDRTLGVLSDDGRARRRLFAQFAELPCPVLEPRTGACLLYRSRPLSCRTFGLPIRCGDEVLPPCELNFCDAAPAVIAASTVEPDPHDVEGTLLERLHREDGTSGDTVIPAAIALEASRVAGRRLARRATLTG